MGKEQQQGQQGLLQGDRQEHQPQIGGGPVGESALEVHLGDGHQGAAEGADRAHNQQHIDRHRREAQQRHQLEQHQGAAGDHGGVAKDRGGIRTLHRLIEPEVHRELGAFAHRSSDQAQAQQGGRQGG